ATRGGIRGRQRGASSMDPRVAAGSPPDRCHAGPPSCAVIARWHKTLDWLAKLRNPSATWSNTWKMKAAPGGRARHQGSFRMAILNIKADAPDALVVPPKDLKPWDEDAAGLMVKIAMESHCKDKLKITGQYYHKKFYDANIKSLKPLIDYAVRS